MRAGRLRYRVRIERATTARDSFGQPKKSWRTVADRVPAQIETLSGDEQVIAASVEARTTHRIMFRHGIDIRPTDRVVCGGVTYNLSTAFDPDGRRQRVECMAVAEYGA